MYSSCLTLIQYNSFIYECQEYYVKKMYLVNKRVLFVKTGVSNIKRGEQINIHLLRLGVDVN